MIRRRAGSTLFPYTTLCRSNRRPPKREPIRARRNALAISPLTVCLNTAYTHVDDVIPLHGFLHQVRLAVLHADQVAVEPGGGAQPLADLLFLGKQAAALALRAV